MTLAESGAMYDTGKTLAVDETLNKSLKLNTEQIKKGSVLFWFCVDGILKFLNREDWLRGCKSMASLKSDEVLKLNQMYFIWKILMLKAWGCV